MHKISSPLTPFFAKAANLLKTTFSILSLRYQRPFQYLNPFSTFLQLPCGFYSNANQITICKQFRSHKLIANQIVLIDDTCNTSCVGFSARRIFQRLKQCAKATFRRTTENSIKKFTLNKRAHIVVAKKTTRKDCVLLPTHN